MKLRLAARCANLLRQSTVHRCIPLPSSSRNFASAVAQQTSVDPNVESQLWVSVLIERLPVITRDLTALEQEYTDLCLLEDDEQSFLSDSEVEERNYNLSMSTGTYKAAIDSSSGEKVLTPQDLEDASQKKLKQFVEHEITSRVTDADTKNDERSLNRALQHRLLLLTLNTFGREGFEGSWGLPQARWVEGESLRETANRVTSAILPDTPCTILGNAPMATYTYTLPPATLQAIGAKGGIAHTHFLFKAFIRSTGGKAAKMGEEVKEYKWLTHKEAIAQLNSVGYKSMARQLSNICYE